VILNAHWTEIAGPELAQVTEPLRFAGKNDGAWSYSQIERQPPWGSWISLGVGQERRAFTRLRQAINDAIQLFWSIT